MRKSSLIVGIGALALATSTQAQVTVWVDFTSDLHNAFGGGANGTADWIDELNKATAAAGVTTFTPSERSDIEAEILSQLATIYFDYDVTFTTTIPVSGEFDAIAYGKTSFGFGSYGIAPNDPANIEASHVAGVATGNFNDIIDEFDGLDFRSTQIAQLSTALAGTGAHELGHTFGLNHHHAYSDPSITPATLSPLAYGPTGGVQNANIMATASTGIDETEREVLRAFSPWEMAMLDFAGGATAGYPVGFDHQSVVSSPVELFLAEGGTTPPFMPPDVPSIPPIAPVVPFTPGETSGMLLAMLAADMDAPGDADMYKFFVPTPSLFTAEIFSDNRFAAPFDFDTLIALLDAGGAMITANDDVHHEGDVFNTLTFQQDDSFLLNIPLMPGMYHLLVHSSPTPSIPFGVGDTYWLAMGLSPIPEPGLLGLLSMATLLLRRR